MNILGHSGAAWLPALLYFLFFWKETRVYASQTEGPVGATTATAGFSQWVLLPLIL